MRYEQLSVGQLTVDQVLGAGEVFRQKVYLDPTNGSDGYDGLALTKARKTYAQAKALVTTGKNDAILLVPGSSALSLAADPAWDFNLTSLIGLAPEAMVNMRSRIGMSTAFSPFITVSGYGNLFKNIYSMHGTAAADYIGWTISGARNAFHNVHFGGPMNSDQGGHASYNGVNITGTENYFKKCVFGTDTIGRDEVTPNVTLGPGTLTIFEDCLFLCNLTDGDPIFVNVLNSSGMTRAFFRGCTFFAFSANHAVAMTVAFAFSAGSSADIVIDQKCSFNNVTNITASASHKYIWLPTVFAAATDEINLVAKNTQTY